MTTSGQVRLVNWKIVFELVTEKGHHSHRHFLRASIAERSANTYEILALRKPILANLGRFREIGLDNRFGY